MKRAVLIFLFAAVFMVLSLNLFGDGVIEQNAIALVIGNNDYIHFAKLRGAGQDAAAIAEELKKIGYSAVGLLLDADAAAINAAIDTFAAKLRERPGCQGFFWYSGMGVQVDHTAYLVGTDADTSDEQLSARTGLVSIGKVFEAMSAARNKLNVVMVDTCFVPVGKNETAVSLEAALLEKLPGNICYIRSASPGEQVPDIGGQFTPSVVKNINNLYSQVLIRRTLLRITKETSIASRDMQIPVYYIPRR